MKSVYYLVIEGVIGAGKTSLVKILGEKLSAKCIFERFEENPFLEDFYRDRIDMPSRPNFISYSVATGSNKNSNKPIYSTISSSATTCLRKTNSSLS